MVWVADRLGFQTGSGDPLDGWQVETRLPDTVHLVVDLPVMHVDLIGHNAVPDRRTITTLLTYRRPIVAGWSGSSSGRPIGSPCVWPLAHKPSSPAAAETGPEPVAA